MSNTISVLNGLIEMLKDGQNGFCAAAGDVQSDELKAIFRRYSLERSTFAAHLQALAESMGEDKPQTGGSVSGALHRGWVEFKAALTNKDEHGILCECERAENSVIAGYRKALAGADLPAEVVETLRTQLNAIETARERVRDLRDSLVAH